MTIKYSKIMPVILFNFAYFSQICDEKNPRNDKSQVLIGIRKMQISYTIVQLRTKVLSRQMSCRNLRNTLRFLFTVLVLVVVQTSKSTQINRLGTQIPKM